MNGSCKFLSICLDLSTDVTSSARLATIAYFVVVMKYARNWLTWLLYLKIPLGLIYVRQL
jgi:hypothetical protein